MEIKAKGEVIFSNEEENASVKISFSIEKGLS